MCTNYFTFFSLHRSLAKCVSGECVCVECEKNINDEITTVNILAKTPYFFLHQNADVSYFFHFFFRSDILLIHFAGRNFRAPGARDERKFKTFARYKFLPTPVSELFAWYKFSHT